MTGQEGYSAGWREGFEAGAEAASRIIDEERRRLSELLIAGTGVPGLIVSEDRALARVASKIALLWCPDCAHRKDPAP